MDKKAYEVYAEKLKALGHPVRLRIALELAEKEYSVNALCAVLDVPQATVSQHLSILRNKGIIEGSRHGTSISYHLSSLPVKEMLEQLRSSVSNKNNGANSKIRNVARA